jgi:hypothetical protein
MATIPEPYENLAALRSTALATKELVEMLAGQRGHPLDVAVTFRDLVNLGLISTPDIPQGIGSDHLQRPG